MSTRARRRQERRQRQQEQEQQRQRVFHLFGQLPTELRLEIWVHSWEPRTISLFPIDYDNLIRPGGKNRLPASGYVNYESRSETLRHYKRCFAHPDKSDFRWFNFRLDTLCVPTSMRDIEKLDYRDFRQVQRLIIPELLPGLACVWTPCPDTWPETAIQSFESPMIEDGKGTIQNRTGTISPWSLYGLRRSRSKRQ
ncbi:hypothetical protein F5B18DRAFT_638118 [Nemania serpens]|nr:hypothetical protein F5B18DRAFT_638118 [Nemania serpens]